MVASGTIRTAVEDRLIEVFAGLDGFTATRAEGRWMVRGPYTSAQLPNRRLVVIGTPDGPFDPDGIQAGAGPSTDGWGISCGIVCTDISDAQQAKQACEDALNAMADELARDGRLGMANGPRDVAVSTVDGPYFATDASAGPTAWINFDIRGFTDIRRNQT